MKTIRKIVLISALACIVLSSAAQGRYNPLTTWPYMYEEFRSGKIITWKGDTAEYDSLNVNLISGRVHYVQDGTIMESDLNTVARLCIGEDIYVLAGGRMMQVLRGTEHGAVVLSVTVDTETMNRSSIGYGTSAIASTRNVSVSAISGEMEYSFNRNLDTARRDRYSGDRLALKQVKGILYKGTFVPATRTDFLKIPGIDKEAVKRFIKTEKIRLSDIDDLARLAEFLYTL